MERQGSEEDGAVAALVGTSPPITTAWASVCLCCCLVLPDVAGFFPSCPASPPSPILRSDHRPLPSLPWTPCIPLEWGLSLEQRFPKSAPLNPRSMEWKWV